MKQHIITFLKRWCLSYIVLSFLFALICLYTKRRLNLEDGYLKVFAGAALSAILGAVSISLFRMRRGNIIAKILLGLLVLMPIVLIMRKIFGVKVFRFGSVAFIVGSLFALIYGIAVTASAMVARRESNRLNALLEDKKEKDPEATEK